MSLTTLDHPLAADLLTILRNKDTQPPEFRQIAERLGYLLVAEALSDMPTEEIAIETPLEPTTGTQLRRPVVAVAVLGPRWLHAKCSADVWLRWIPWRPSITFWPACRLDPRALFETSVAFAQQLQECRTKAVAAEDLVRQLRYDGAVCRYDLGVERRLCTDEIGNLEERLAAE